MENATIKVRVEDKYAEGFTPYLILPGHDYVTIRLSCGSELTIDEMTLRRALSVIDVHRKEFGKTLGQ